MQVSGGERCEEDNNFFPMPLIKPWIVQPMA
jgi:hypothetical protein